MRRRQLLLRRCPCGARRAIDTCSAGACGCSAASRCAPAASTRLSRGWRKRARCSSRSSARRKCSTSTRGIAECRTVRRRYRRVRWRWSTTRLRGPCVEGGAKAISVLERVRGHALLRKGDYAGARQALEASLAAARARQRPAGNRARAALAASSAIAGRATSASRTCVAECESLVAQLKIRVLPPSAGTPRSGAHLPENEKRPQGPLFVVRLQQTCRLSRTEAVANVDDGVGTHERSGRRRRDGHLRL